MSAAPPDAAGELPLGVLGLGHVGLPTALGLAELGWTVAGADDDRDKTRMLERGEAPFYEPGIGELLVRHLGTGRFRVAASGADAVRASKVLFVCVGTPQRDDGAADLTQMERAARTIAANLDGYKLIVVKSTSPVSTTRSVMRAITEHADGGHGWDLAVNPEFLREGQAIEDFLDPARIVIGVESERARDLLLRVYDPIIRRTEPPQRRNGAPPPARGGAGDDKVVITDPGTAELIKHAANAFLATKVSFINMVADLCEAIGADIDDVTRGIGLDPRIGPEFLQAGVGFGGHCLPKDLQAFVRGFGEHGVESALLEAVDAVNRRRPGDFVDRVRAALGGLGGRTLAVWGLAFKPGVDDVRDAPSLRIVPLLAEEGALLRLYDPQAMDEFRRAYRGPSAGVEYACSAAAAAVGADAVLVLTEWPEFLQADLASLRAKVARPLVVDGRNCMDRAAVARAGFSYAGMGRIPLEAAARLAGGG